MGLFSSLFKKKTSSHVTPTSTKLPIECQSLLALADYMNKLLNSDTYISRKEYRSYLLGEKRTIEFFAVLESSNMLASYCTANGIRLKDVCQALSQYSQFETLIDQHNDQYITETMHKEKHYLDTILHDVDPQIMLDDDQRRVILCDEDYCLVIAGAGAGKTTTVAAKVKYLVEKKKIDPSQILVVSFTNKAVSELREKLNRDLKINCPIATFHSTGNAILRKQSEEKLNIVDSSKLYFVIQDYFKNSLLKNEPLVNNLILFFASYFDAPFEGNDLNDFFNKIAKSNYTTLRSDLNEYCNQIVDLRTKKTVTIQNEMLRSRQEVEIANFLYLHNIDYEYEAEYPYHIPTARKPYTPDFLIRQGDCIAYLEHFGISQDGKNNRFSSDQLESYKNSINTKVELHKKHGTKLIYTFSQYNDNRPLVEHLREELEKHGFTLTPRSGKEIMEKLIVSEENRYIRRLVSLICRFIANFKTNGYTADEFTRMYHSTTNVRSRLFLDICHDCYLEYDRYLKEHNAVDFEDMINESARVLREVKEMQQKLDFRYIIVDEYQDISRQRFDLVTALADVTDAKIIAVGDDWQSIYAFSGSDITLFTNFSEKMGYAKLLKIVKTYRNAQEVIDIAGNFIQKNDTQIKKALTSPKNITDPVIIYTYDGSFRKTTDSVKNGVNYAIAYAVETALKQIMEYNRTEGKTDSSILLLGRFGFDGDKLEKSGLFEYSTRGGKLKSVKYPHLDITFMTAHASKGLGYDNVIVVNGRNETYGFPSKIEDDPVLSFVIKGDRSIDYAEERRLFYVAMTRTKNRVYFIAPEQNPSEFLLEIKRDYKNVSLRGEWNEENTDPVSRRKTCPICGYPLQYRYKTAYGLRLYICTNEPEICGFLTNDIKGEKLSIMKCEDCKSGYLIIKHKKDGDYFLGCTNYLPSGEGCNRSLSKIAYYDLYKLSASPSPAVVFKRTSTSKPTPVISQTKLSVTTNPASDNTSSVIPTANVKSVVYRDTDLNNMVHTVLQCVSHISQKRFYGINVLVDVLRGARSQKIQEMKLYELTEYGALKHIERETLITLVDWLIENHYLLKTKGQYPVLHITFNGTHYNEKITAQQLKKLYSVLNDSSAP
ncbi:MAG: UvrD-helicase domain-containing protein [Clostridia bacterium]|nr:UvrD-helicase domain-containing protein [Clostridia bacterium]